MRSFFSSSAGSAAAFLALMFAVLPVPAAAHDYECCRRDVTSYVLSCSFDTMNQCKAMSSGRGGDCLRDPFVKEIGNAFSYASSLSRTKGAPVAKRRACDLPDSIAQL